MHHYNLIKKITYIIYIIIYVYFKYRHIVYISILYIFVELTLMMHSHWIYFMSKDN